MRGHVFSQRRTLDTQRLRRILEFAPFDPIHVALAWISYGVVFMAGVNASVNLAPLVLIPVALTTVGRRPSSGILVGVLVGASLLVLMNAVDLRPPLPPVIVGGIATAFVGAMVAFTHSVAFRLVEETYVAVKARERADDVHVVYRSLYDGLPVGLWRIRPDGVILEVNPAAAAMFGYSIDEILNINAKDLYVNPAARSSLIDSLIQRGVQRGDVLVMRHRDGHRIFVRVSTQVVRDDDGAVRYFDGVGFDITSEVASERRRIASDERFRWAFESAPVPMVLVSADLRIVRANRAHEQLLGYDAGELEGRTVASISVAEDMDENLRVRRESLEAGSAFYQMRKRYIRKDGEIVNALLSVSQLVGSPDEGTAVSFVLDMTDQMKAQSALEQLVQAKDEFLATVSHELRTPLTVVHGMSHELRDGWTSFTEEERREMAGLIAEQSSELTFLVEDYLVIARENAGNLEVNVEIVDLRAEVEAAMASVPRQATERVELQCGDAYVVGDRLRLRQIIRNLLTNAQRYGGDRVVVRAAPQGAADVCALQVVDNGDGVPEQLITEIFEPYKRAHSLGVATEAVGLGLTVSRTLAEIMGGTLEYRRDGDWSVFELTLPIKERVSL